MTYNEWLLRLQTAAATTNNDTNFLDYVPNFIDLAEQRCYRDLDLLSTVVRDTSSSCVVGTRNFTLPSPSGGPFRVVNGINIITPFGNTVATGTRNRLTQLSLDALDVLWPTNTAAAATTVPTYFAMITDQDIAFGPPPGNAFQVEVVGTIRPDPLSPTNTETYLTLYLPDLFFAASMVAVAGYQRDFGAQGDDPKLAMSWEQEYKMRLASAVMEEQRKRFASSRVGFFVARPRCPAAEIESMPFEKITLRPGINTMATQTANQGGWSQSNLIRYRQGYLEKVGGWARYFENAVAGTVRALFAYQDLEDNKNLMIGGDGGLQVYLEPKNNGAPSLVTVRLARRTDTELYASVDLDTLSGTSGSATITVHDPGHGASIGDEVAIPLPISIGQRTIQAQNVTVAGVADANNWSFTNSQTLLANANTGGSYGTTPVFFVTAAEQNTETVRVIFPYHGFVIGSSFAVQFAVVWQQYGNMLSVPSGTYSVASIVDANTFTISTPGVTQTALSGGAEVGFDSAQAVDTIYGVLGLVYYQDSDFAAPSGQWSIDNFGGSIIIGLGDGPIYVFIPPVSTAGSPTSAQLISDAPLINAGTLVAMPQAQVIAYGSETTIGSGVQDPLMVRWSDAGDYDEWVASATNQAGSFRLSRGSRIIGATQAPQTTLLWTDIELWSMSYIQPPLVYSFTVIGSGCGIISSGAMATLGRNTYWMSLKGFYSFGDNGVQYVECPVWDTVFATLPVQPVNSYIFAGVDEPFGEIWWFYPSADSEDGECDSYVKWNVGQGPNGWDYGSLDRTAWIGVNVFGMPLAADSDDHIQQHESGYDDDDAAMDGVYAESGFFDIGSGDAIPFLDQFIPDIKWFGDGGSLNFTVWGVNYPSDTPEMYGPYTVTPSSQIVPARVRQRQIALRVDWANTAGFSARLGAIRARIAPAGRRP